MATNAAKRIGNRATAHRKAMVWSVLVIVLGAMVLPLTGYLYVGVQPVLAAEWQDNNPRSDYWGEVRREAEGYSTAELGPRGDAADVLIQGSGQNWREIRNGWVSNITPWFMALMLLAIGIFHIIHGRSRLEQPRSGETIERWTLFERTLHWFTAILFIIMAITGLSLLFGRAVILPWLGPAGFGAYAMFAKILHNYLGPLFSVGVVLIVLSWIRWNIPTRTDLQWFKRWGGMRKGKHASAGRMNGGEKVWFWFIATFGVAVCVTGVIMDFPGLGQSRATMQVSNIIHSVIGILWIAILFGHAYIGTLGTEGALEGMTTGEVSVEWARQHHDLWYEEVRQREATDGGEAPPAAEKPSAPRP